MRKSDCPFYGIAVAGIVRTCRTITNKLPTGTQEIEKNGFPEIKDHIFDDVTKPESDLPPYPGMDK